MAFLLGVEHQGDGYSRITYDVGVTDRVVLTVRTVDVESVLALPADDVVGDVFDTVRPPQRKV